MKTHDELEEFIASHLLSDEAAAHLRAIARDWQQANKTSGRSYAGRLDMIFEGDTGSNQPVDIQRPTSVAPMEEAPTRGDEFTRAGARYELKGLLGRGGMGEVWRVRDRDLNRTLAMKIVRWELAQKDRVVARFIEEAQTCAQLQHPGIVPIYEIGRLPDGRLYFTMEEIRGLNLREVIDELHTASDKEGRWAQTEHWNFRALMRAFAQACQAVAFAHARGVIHRDIKPANIMLGDDGRVLVVDWGISKIIGRHDLAADLGDYEPVVTKRATTGEILTRPGAITGTPNYMAPEQVMSEGEDLGAKTDVYALGGVLYKLLSGKPPYGQGNAMATFIRIAKGPPQPPEEITRLGLPAELVAICKKAMNSNTEERYANAGELADAVNDWLEGVQRRERAITLVEQARQASAIAEDIRAEAASLEGQSARALQTVPPFAPEEMKHEGWALREQASVKRREAALASLEAEQLLQSALQVAPDLLEAHEALALHHRELHELAEAREDADASAAHEVQLRARIQHLPPLNALRGSCERYLEGTGTLSLAVDAPGATITLKPYELVNQRLQLGDAVELGEAPIRDHALAPGSYMLEIDAPGHHGALYPVHIERQGNWNAARPDDPTNDLPVALLAEGQLDEDEVYVPAGWFTAGGEPTTAGGFDKRRYWADGFVVQKFPTTNAQFIEFLNDLLAQGREDEALQHAPRERAAGAGEQGSMLYSRDEEGLFTLHADAERRGRAVDPLWPATNVDWNGALAYAEWYAERTGKAWRLPTEWELEKAARGVDGRAYPWGPIHDPSWSCMQDSRMGQPHADVIDSFPVDVSPYGVRGVAGNVSVWCLNLFSLDAPDGELLVAPDGAPALDDLSLPRVGRGGAWFFPPKFCQSAWRFRFMASYRYGFLGVRLLRPL